MEATKHEARKAKRYLPKSSLQCITPYLPPRASPMPEHNRIYKTADTYQPTFTSHRLTNTSLTKRIKTKRPENAEMKGITPLLLIGLVIIAGCSSATGTERLSCTPEQREAEACAEIYEPVCATVNIVCIRAPCYPVNETFPNACEACRNQLVDTYVKGEC